MINYDNLNLFMLQKINKKFHKNVGMPLCLYKNLRICFLLSEKHSHILFKIANTARPDSKMYAFFYFERLRLSNYEKISARGQEIFMRESLLERNLLMRRSRALIFIS
jgi:hypothetical protein